MFGLVLKLESAGFDLNIPTKDIENKMDIINTPEQIVELIL